MPILNERPLSKDQALSIKEEPDLKHYNEYGILNYTNETIYVLSLGGDLEEIPPMSISMQVIMMRAKSVYIYHRKQTAPSEPTERNTLAKELKDECMCSNKIDRNKYLHTKQYLISEMDLDNNVFYLKQLGLIIGTDANLVMNYIPTENPYFLNLVNREVDRRLIGYVTSPWKFHFNDPDKRVNCIYVSFGKTISQIPVTHNPAQDLSGVIEFIDKNRKTIKYNVDFKELINTKDHILLSIGDDEDVDLDVLCIGLTKDEVNKWIYEARVTNDRIYTKLDVEKHVKASTYQLEEVITKFKSENKSLQFELTSCNRMLNDYQKREEEIRQREDKRRQEEFELIRLKTELASDELKSKTEEVKYKKEVKSANASEIASWSTIIKSAAVIVPIVVGLYYTWKKNQSATVVAKCLLSGVSATTATSCIIPASAIIAGVAILGVLAVPVINKIFS